MRTNNIVVIFVNLLYNKNAYSRAVANGPVGPAMAGPIIEPVIKTIIKLFFSIYFLAGFGRNNKRELVPIFLIILFEVETTVPWFYMHSDDSICMQFLSIP